MLRIIAILLAAALLTSCAAAPPPTSRVRHVIGIGFESLVGETDWAALAEQLADASVDEVSIAVGRLDWLAYPPETVGLPSGPVRETGRDYVAEALAGLEPWVSTGVDRRITLTIDALIPGLIRQRPGLAAVRADGQPTTEFASVTALEGSVGDDLVTLTSDIARRYRPNEISVTELFIDHSFGPDDRMSFTAFSGATDWPRRADGSIDTAASALAPWRSAAIAALAGRMAESSHASGIPFAMDVRVNWQHPGDGRPDSGQDYAALLDRVDRLTLWCYTALAGVAPTEIRRLPPALAEAGLDVDRMVVSIGLWTDGTDGAISPALLRTLAVAADASGARAVGVTPLSLIDESHWDVLTAQWADR